MAAVYLPYVYPTTATEYSRLTGPRLLTCLLGRAPARAAARGEVELEGARARRDRGGDRVEVGRAEVPRQGRGGRAQPEDPLVRVRVRERVRVRVRVRVSGGCVGSGEGEGEVEGVGSGEGSY